MAVLDAYKNLAISSVATAPSPATSGTSLTVAAGEGVRFPAVPFNATIQPAAALPTPANAEIVRVTARATDVLTIVRAQEGTTARTVVVGDILFAAQTAKSIDDQRDAQNLTGTLLDARLSSNIPRLDGNGTNVFTGGYALNLNNVRPKIGFLETDAPANNQRWNFVVDNQTFFVEALDDGGTTVGQPWTLNRFGDERIARELYEKGRSTPMGHWIDIPYSSGLFTSSAGAWVVDAGDFAGLSYTLVGKTLWLQFFLIGTTLTIQSQDLMIALPFTASSSWGATAIAVDAGDGAGYATGWAIPNPSTAVLLIRRHPTGGLAWTAQTNTINVFGTAMVRLA